MATVYSLAQQTIRLVQFLGLFSEGVRGFRDLMLSVDHALLLILLTNYLCFLEGQYVLNWTWTYCLFTH